MAVLTRSEMVTLARQLALDNGTNLGVDATTAIAIVNDAYFFVVELGPERVEVLSPTALGFAAGLSNSTKSATITDTTIRDILQLMNVGGASSTQGTVLERVEPWRIRALFGESSVAGAAQYWAIERDPTTTAADVGKLRLHVYPTPTATWYVAAVCLVHPTALANDSDKPDVTDEESRIIARLAAAEIARITGRDQGFIAEITSRLPQQIQAALQERGSFYRPTKRGPDPVRPGQ